MTDTVKQHFENCKQVSQILDDANALLTKTRNELAMARLVLEALIEYQHPKVSVENYVVKQIMDRGAAAPENLIRAEVARINALLGDRA